MSKVSSLNLSTERVENVVEGSKRSYTNFTALKSRRAPKIVTFSPSSEYYKLYTPQGRMYSLPIK
jgi:hypothetical protein